MIVDTNWKAYIPSVESKHEIKFNERIYSLIEKSGIPTQKINAFLEMIALTQKNYEINLAVFERIPRKKNVIQPYREAAKALAMTAAQMDKFGCYAYIKAYIRNKNSVYYDNQGEEESQ